MKAIHRFYLEGHAARRGSGEEEPEHGIQQALLLFERQSQQSLLDIGCYDGRKTAVIRDYLGADQAWGVDFISGALDEARTRGIEVHECNLNEDRITFDDSSFDCIFLGDVIEHVFSPDHLLSECFRLLKPFGYVVLTTPNLASWRNRIGLLAGWQPLGTEVSTVAHLGNPFAPSGIPAGHLRIFTFRALAEIAQIYGFRPEVIAGYSIGDPTPQRVISRVFHLVDTIVGRVYPVLSDELLIKLRKTGTAGK